MGVNNSSQQAQAMAEARSGDYISIKRYGKRRSLKLGPRSSLHLSYNPGQLDPKHVHCKAVAHPTD